MKNRLLNGEMMKATEFFNQKPKPTILDENPKSIDDYDREMLNQLCYDMQVDDDEIDELVQSLIDWKNKRCDIYSQSK